MNEATERFHHYARAKLEQIDAREELERQPGKYDKRRNRLHAILDVDLARRPALVVRCDLEPACRNTLARVYATSRGPLWVPTKERANKDEIDFQTSDLIVANMLPPILSTCRDGHEWPGNYHVRPVMILREYDESQKSPDTRKDLNASEFALPLNEAHKA